MSSLIVRSPSPIPTKRIRHPHLLLRLVGPSRPRRSRSCPRPAPAASVSRRMTLAVCKLSLTGFPPCKCLLDRRFWNYRDLGSIGSNHVTSGYIEADILSPHSEVKARFRWDRSWIRLSAHVHQEEKSIHPRFSPCVCAIDVNASTTERAKGSAPITKVRMHEQDIACHHVPKIGA
jgi:hypothetical protein